jgi:hypothetical protein
MSLATRAVPIVDSLLIGCAADTPADPVGTGGASAGTAGSSGAAGSGGTTGGTFGKSAGGSSRVRAVRAGTGAGET